MKFVIEADGIPEPVLVFIEGEFQIYKGQTENIHKIQLKLGRATTYEIYFDNAEEQRKFVDKIAIYARQ